MDQLIFPVKAMGFNLVGEIGVLAPAFDEAGPYRDKVMADLEKAANDLFENMTNTRPIEPGMSDIVFFNKLKTKIAIHKNKFPADYDYWQARGWLDADYFFPVKITSLKKIIGALPVKLIKRTLRRKLGVDVYKKFIGQYPRNR